jgi:hypothetical protein
MTMLLTAVAALQITADSDKFNDFLLLGYGIMWLIVMIYIASQEDDEVWN